MVQRRKLVPDLTAGSDQLVPQQEQSELVPERKDKQPGPE